MCCAPQFISFRGDSIGERKQSQHHLEKLPGFPVQADYILTIVNHIWHHSNQTKSSTRSCHDQSWDQKGEVHGQSRIRNDHKFIRLQSKNSFQKFQFIYSRKF